MSETWNVQSLPGALRSLRARLGLGSGKCFSVGRGLRLRPFRLRFGAPRVGSARVAAAYDEFVELSGSWRLSSLEFFDVSQCKGAKSLAHFQYVRRGAECTAYKSLGCAHLDISAQPLEVPGSPWSEPPGGFRHAGIGVQLDPQQSELIVCYRAAVLAAVLGPKTRGLAVSSEPCQVRGRTAGLQEAALEEARLPLESARSAACAASPSSVQGRGSEVRDRRGMAQGSGPHSDC